MEYIVTTEPSVAHALSTTVENLGGHTFHAGCLLVNSNQTENEFALCLRRLTGARVLVVRAENWSYR